MKPMEARPPGPFAERYWAIWMVVTLCAFLWLEILSLCNGHPENTLSAWVWEHLKIRVGESITQWSAGDLLVFAAYVTVFVCWLPVHFWWGKFR